MSQITSFWCRYSLYFESLSQFLSGIGKGAIRIKLTMLRCLGLSFLILAIPVAAQTVTDGDTIKHNGRTYRLWGIDAPESKQTCADGWEAGRQATEAMVNLLQGRRVECFDGTQDRYGRTVALCFADDVNVSAEMARIGMAWAFIRYSPDYVALEAGAKAASLGVHAHGCESAWEYRARIRGDR